MSQTLFDLIRSSSKLIEFDHVSIYIPASISSEDGV